MSLVWPDCQVELLEEGEYTSLVRHVSSGAVLRIFNYLFWKNGSGELCSGDFSDAQPAVHAGDIVSVIAEAPGIALIKNDGKTGIYCGALAEI